MSPELELQGAIVAALKADPAVSGIAAGHIYDRVPEDRVFPYVSIGATDTVEADAECLTGYEITQQIDIWSREVGYPECKRLTDAVRAALHEIDLALATNALVFLRCIQARMYRDPDGLTSHGALTFEASVERP